jgi:murein DD-endopeptidase MepM/ murein hydrolase activator NlpD
MMTKQPVAEVVANGTAPRPLTASYGTYIWPAEGIITSNFGYRTGFGSSNHQGIDIAGDYGQTILAADGGEVIMSDWYSGYGYLIQIKHDNGYITYYGHCSELLVAEGERVYQGQEIALMGATGQASGVHLHFEVRQNAEPIDPLTVLP